MERTQSKNCGPIGNCARKEGARCGMKNPLECKVHRDANMRKIAAAQWKIAEERLQ